MYCNYDSIVNTGACPIKKLMRIKFNIDINSNGKLVIELRRALS